MRIIDADSLINKIEQSYLTKGEKRLFKLKIEHAPTIEPVKWQIDYFRVLFEKAKIKGVWISCPDNDYMGGGCVVCSVCDQHYSWGAYHEPEAFKFCPNCGAKMEG